MPIQLSDLRKDRRTIPVQLRVGSDDVGEPVYEELTVTYTPSKFTADFDLSLNEILEGKWKLAWGLAFVGEMVTEWDLMDGDAVIGLDQKSLAALPNELIGYVIRAITADMGKVQADSNDS